MRCCNELLHNPHSGINPAQLGIGPHNYARQLARYMRDPSKVRAGTMYQWGRAPTIEQCRELINEAQGERQRYREESDRLAPKDIDALDYRPLPTRHAKEVQERIDRKRNQDIAVVEQAVEAEPANDDPEPQRSHFLTETVYQVCRAMGVVVADVVGNSRVKAVVRARHVVFYVLHKRGQSLTQIGRRLGCDHTSVMYALRIWDVKATDNMRKVAAFFVSDADEVAA